MSGKFHFPRPEDLNAEELDYELLVRQQPDEVFDLDETGKQRQLRLLFKDDIKENRVWATSINIINEADHINTKIEKLRKALEKKVEHKFESKVLHYWARTKRCIAKSESDRELRRRLIEKIEKLMRDFQFGPTYQESKSSPLYTKQQAHSSRTFRGLGTQKQGNFEDGKRESTPVKQLQNFGEKKPEETKQITSEELLAVIEGMEEFEQKSEIQPNPGDPNPNPVQTEMLNVPRQEWEEWKNCIKVIVMNQRRAEEEARKRAEAERWKKLLDRKKTTNDRYDSDSLGGSSSDSTTSYSSFVSSARRRRHGGNNYERHEHNDSRRNFRRIEKWKIRFSGDNRAMTVESFLYKANKLAEREGVTKNILLRDMHLLLEGTALEWFFTFVDDFDCWKSFEQQITSRFGDPNKDQGIRSKIQERKQLRDETFIAFVTEIEKLNRMLSKPLSNQRKFEVIWDNMRQHYRSKISIVKVDDLQQLIDLNVRIDAADHTLNQNREGSYRRTVNQIEVEESDYNSEEDTPINEISSRPLNRFRNGSGNVGAAQASSAGNRGGVTRGTGSSNQERSQQGSQLRATQPSRQTQTQQTQSNPGQAAGVNRTEQQSGSVQLQCWNCQGSGHGWRQCDRPRVIFCYGCGILGRTIRNCERCSQRSQRQGNE